MYSNRQLQLKEKNNSVGKVPEPFALNKDQVPKKKLKNKCQKKFALTSLKHDQEQL